MTRPSTALLMTIISLLVGCSSQMVAPIKKDVEANEAKATRLAGRVGSSETAKTSLVEHSDGIWLPAQRVARKQRSVVESAALKRKVTVMRSFAKVQDVSDWVTSNAGIASSVAQELSPISATPAAGPAGAPAPGSASTASTTAPATPVVIAYSGSLRGFLEAAAAKFNVAWRWEENDSIQFFRTTSRTFRVLALPGDTSMDSAVSSSGSSSGGASGATSSGTATQSTKISFATLSIWKALEDSVKTMLSTTGKVTVTPATGTITVTDTVPVLTTVERFIDQQNLSMGRQVVVNVRVLSVELTDSDDYGINWNLVYNSLPGNAAFTFGTAAVPTAATTALTLKVLGTALTTGAPNSATANVKAWAGSSAIIAALSKQGRVSQVTSASLTTMNNQPAPLQVGKTTAYVASSTTTPSTTAGVAATTTLTPGSVTTGFSMGIVPHVLDADQLLLQYSIDISALTSAVIPRFGPAANEIQIPEVSTRNFLQRVRVQSGETLVMSGFEQDSLSALTKGPGSADNAWAGGSVAGSRTRTVLVVLLQPVIVPR